MNFDEIAKTAVVKAEAAVGYTKDMPALTLHGGAYTVAEARTANFSREEEIAEIIECAKKEIISSFKKGEKLSAEAMTALRVLSDAEEVLLPEEDGE